MTPETLYKQKKWYPIFIHLAAWCILFILPAIFIEQFNGHSPIGDFRLFRFFIQPIGIVILFYINYLLLIDKLLFRQKATQYFVVNLLLIILCCMIAHMVHQLIGERPHSFPPELLGHRPPPRHLFMPWQDILILILVVGLSVAIKISQKWRDAEKERQQLEQERTEAELTNLKNQLNPHFLFNTLNNIYSLIAISPEQAQSAVLELSKLLRYMLYENTQSHIAIEKELEFNRNYIELMRLRLARHVQVDVNIPSQLCPGKLIAPLLFISLIENAFKHGTSASKRSFVKIDMSEPKPGVIACNITNSYFPKNKSDKSGSGIGLKNLTRQLELLYPERYVLKLDHDNTTYRSALTIDLNQSPSKPL